MNLSSLTSSSSSSNTFHSLSAPLSKNRQSRPLRVSAITCSSTTILNNTANPNNFYKMLCVSPESATTAEIKRAYRSMALRHHPDVCRDASAKEESTRMLVLLNAAYETLSDPCLRQQYDCQVLGLRTTSVTEEEGNGIGIGIGIHEGFMRRRRMGHKGRSQRMRNRD